MVSISGRPAATSDPKASTRIAIVTGHESSSDLSIASRLASLKSDHIPDAPVRLTCTPVAAVAARETLRSFAAATISLASFAAPAMITAVCPSGEIETPGRGAITCRTAGSAASTASARARVRRKAGSPTVRPGEWTTA